MKKKMEWNNWRNPSEDLQFLDFIVHHLQLPVHQFRSLWPKAWNDGISKVLWTKAPEALRKRFGGRPLEKVKKGKTTKQYIPEK